MRIKIFSVSLESIEVIDIGRKSLQTLGRGIFATGVMQADFHWVGTMGDSENSYLFCHQVGHDALEP